MRILRLDFSQKIWLGFAIIVLLLSLSSLLAIYNLNDIRESTNQVNESAVPVLKQSNQIQINLLKLGNLSSQAFNASDELKIQEVEMSFRQGTENFEKLYHTLVDTVSDSKEMADKLAKARENYDAYVVSVESMLSAKKQVIDAVKLAENEQKELLRLTDDAGAFMLDVVYVDYEEDDNKRELMEGISGRIDGLIFGLNNIIDEINRSSDLAYLENATVSIEESVNGIRVRNESAENNLPDLKEIQNWIDYKSTLESIQEKATSENSIIQAKLLQVKQTSLSREKLDESNDFLQKVVTEFDSLLVAADELFNASQTGVIETVSLSSQTAIIAWIILILLASQNFNSMRKSIKKKMADLAKLNSTGEILASLLDQNKALEEVLAAMHEQTGVSFGSVFLMNNEDKLEVKASFPPKQTDPSIKPVQFSLGEGILGKVAKSKRIKFVRNTANEPDFVSGDNVAPKSLLCVPLIDKDVLIGAMNFSGEVNQVSFEDSDYEFASSIARLLVTTIKNIRMREVIEEQNRNLEAKVKERTAELQKKNNDIATMMANLQQGIFTIMDGGVIHSEYSSHLEDIVETKQIANRNFMDVIFAQTSLGVDVKDQISTAIDSLLGMDAMMFDFNSHLLVNEVTLGNNENGEKLVELDWVPIVNQNDEIEKILVTVRDVTELRALQSAAEEQKKELEIVGQILSVDRDKFDEFIAGSYAFISDCRELIKSTKDKDLSVIATLFRNMHTVKGNARTYGFNYITDSVHTVEHTYDELRKIEDKSWEQEFLLEELDLAEKDINKYEQIAREKLSGSGSSGGVKIDVENINLLLKSASSLDLSKSDSDVNQWINDCYQCLSQTQGVTADKMLSEVISSISSLAAELGKPEPKVNIDTGGIAIRNEIHNRLANVFMHVLRNAIDHGIESIEERKKNSKPESGNIDIKISADQDKIEFIVKDDGRGMALNKIYQSAVEKEIYSDKAPRPSDNEIAQLIFSSGFSTAENVSEISGRGVGMDAVKQFLNEAGGDVEVKLTEGSEGDDYRAFETIITIDRKYLVSGLKLH
ncbi:ATP-binding protein [Aliikangiella sp. G2MR2-5]|uniref:ATP-binding protein n=1 Tax=Aliikangiella sp. G2MR2-5 TaxID=2788943 RepID=UPI0018AC32EB|nr:ATP-binding protein [Aliikangiella sp. G2MR2-5]